MSLRLLFVTYCVMVYGSLCVFVIVRACVDACLVCVLACFEYDFMWNAVLLVCFVLLCVCMCVF